MAKFDGTNIKISVDGNYVARATSASMNYTNNLIETTDKDSGGDAEFIAGKREWDMSFDGLSDYAATFGVEGFWDAISAGTALTVYFSTDTSGDLKWSGTMYADSMTMDGPLHDVASWSGTMKGTGAVTKATV